MKLVYLEPHCRNLETVDCKKKTDIKKVLKLQGMTKDQCLGEIVKYVFIDSEGNVTEGELDFT